MAEPSTAALGQCIKSLFEKRISEAITTVTSLSANAAANEKVANSLSDMSTELGENNQRLQEIEKSVDRLRDSQ